MNFVNAAVNKTHSCMYDSLLWKPQKKIADCSNVVQKESKNCVKFGYAAIAKMHVICVLCIPLNKNKLLNAANLDV